MRAFNSPYVSSADSFCSFEAFLHEQFVDGMSGDNVFPYLVLLQSSGWGKTRFTFEYCRDRNVLLLYLNLREDESGYPPTSTQTTKILSLMTGASGAEFVKSLVISALVLSKSEKWLASLRRAADEHSLVVFNDFWDECVGLALHTRTETAAATTSTAAASASTSINSTQPSLSTSSSSSSSNSSASVQILLVIDEARTLLGDNAHSSISLNSAIPSRLRVFRNALHELRPALQSEGVVVLLLDTFSKVSNFCPSKQLESSSARSNGLSVLAPYFALGFDPLRFTELPAGTPALDFDAILLYGRPLWRATALCQANFKNLITFAGRKLLLQTRIQGSSISRHDSAATIYNSCCAVVCCLLDLEAQSSLSSNLVASHMVRV